MLFDGLFAKEPTELPEAKAIFEKHNVNGSILIFDQKNKSYTGYNLDRCNTGFSPASTFKIANTLIAFEKGVITKDSVFVWGGEKRRYERWEADMNIHTAFQVSNVPIYQDIARSIGLESMQYYTRLLHYGNMDITEDNLDKFWLEGDSKISQYQQIFFLNKLYNHEYPLKDETVELVKHIMIIEKTPNYTLSGKTGWAEVDGKDIGWFIGYVETDDNVFFFATNIEPRDSTNMKEFGQIRIKLTKELLLING